MTTSKTSVKKATAKKSTAKKATVTKSALNSFLSTVTDFSTAESDKAASAENKFNQTADTDFKRAMQKSATKSKYTALLTAMSESALEKALELFAESAIFECFNDSYSCKKFTQLCEALAANNKALIKDNKLSSFCTQFALAKDSEHYTKYLSACANSDRQTQMCAKMFERLNIAHRVKAEYKLFNKQDNDARKALESLYE